MQTARTRHLVLAAAIVAMAAAALVVWEVNSFVVQDLVRMIYFGYAPHRIPYSEWPISEAVIQTLELNAELVADIEAVNPDWVSVHIQMSDNCPGRADIVIVVDSLAKSDMEAIRSLIGHDRYFLGIPYSFYAMI